MINELKKEAAKTIHHDTITGTSLIYIIYNETIELHQNFDKNAENLQDMFATKVINERGLRLDELTLCTPRLNDRNLCLDPLRARRTQQTGHSFVYLVYNPSVQDMESIMFTVPYSTFQISAFDDSNDTFSQRLNKDLIDTFCFENPNHELECDVHIF